jgi:hypothetical protein
MTDRKCSSNSTYKRRPAFTFVEILVVVGIMVILVGLIASGTIQVITYQRTSNTETTIRTLSSFVDRQWSAVAAQASKEEIPQGVLNISGFYNPVTMTWEYPNVPRARVIWKKLRQKQEFPMNFTEAIFPWKLPVPGPLSANDLPPRPTYKAVLPPTGGDTDPRKWPRESSPCLILALKASRGGTALTDDLLPRGAMTTIIAPTVSLSAVNDAWGEPLYFYRWPTMNQEVDDSCPSGRFDETNSKTWVRDPDDPNGLLLDPTWNNVNNYKSFQGVYWFEQYCHPVHDVDRTGNYRARAFYAVPVITSAGRNNRLGRVQAGSLNSPLLPDLMSVDPTDPDGALDNIDSYRLRLGARGD